MECCGLLLIWAIFRSDLQPASQCCPWRKGEGKINNSLIPCQVGRYSDRFHGELFPLELLASKQVVGLVAGRTVMVW